MCVMRDFRKELFKVAWPMLITLHGTHILDSTALILLDNTLYRFT